MKETYEVLEQLEKKENESLGIQRELDVVTAALEASERSLRLFCIMMNTWLDRLTRVEPLSGARTCILQKPTDDYVIQLSERYTQTLRHE